MMRQARAQSVARASVILAPACLVSGPLIWFAHFTLLYGGHTAFCAIGTPGMHLLVIAATIAAGLLLIMVAVASLRALTARTAELSRGQRFQHQVAMLVVGLSAVAVAWVGITATVVPACS
jgi:hypothetical protein